MVSNMIKRLLKNALNTLGYSINKNTSGGSNPFLDQKKLIGDVKDAIVFDVGAHHGESALLYNSLFNNGNIFSFEPFKESYKVLCNKVNKYDNIFTFNLALGNTIGNVNFHSNRFSATNSILPTHPDASQSWGNSLETIKEVKVEISTIDNFIERNDIKKIDILKIDTQGTEYDVIEGALQSIQQNKIRLIYLEIITKHIYQNQRFFDEILYLLRVNGFELFNIYNLSRSKFGDLRQVDVIFLNTRFYLP